MDHCPAYIEANTANGELEWGREYMCPNYAQNFPSRVGLCDLCAKGHRIKTAIIAQTYNKKRRDDKDGGPSCYKKGQSRTFIVPGKLSG